MLVDGLPDALLVQSNDVMVFVNPAFVSLMGASSEDELIGKHISTIIHPNHLATVKDQIAIDYERGVPSLPLEHVLVRLDCSVVAVEAIGRPVIWDGQPAIEVVIRDISGRKRAEELLADLEKRFQLAERAGRLGLWEWDFATGQLTWSDEIYRQFGYTRENFAGQTAAFLARIHPEDQPAIQAACEAVQRHGANYDVQFRTVLSDGQIRWIDSHGVIKPNTTLMIGVASDITELKNAQAKIEESERNYRLVLDSTAEGIYSLDLAGTCTSCNAAAARLLGYDNPNDILGKPVHQLHHHTRVGGSDYPVEDCSIYRAFRQGRGTHVDDEVFFRTDGTSFPCEYWSYPIRRDDQVVGCVVTFLDITERQKAEERLRRSEEQYRSIVQNAPYGIYRSTLQGKLLMANPRLVQMLGFKTEDEILALNLAEDVYRRPEQRAELVARVLESGAVSGGEVMWKRKDGQPITVRHSATAVRDSDGNIESFQVFVEDVSERKALEKQFWQAQKMEAVGRLAGGIAHDFNNVLMVASSYANLITQSGVESERVLRYAKQIERATARAATVTRQLLAFSRKQMLELEELDFNAVISDLSKILPQIMGEDVQVLTVTRQSSRVLADRGQAEQIIMNLAVNARDAMPRGGRFTLETHSAIIDASPSNSVSPLPPGNYVLLSISDTGIGMDTETKSRIFEPFFTTKERGKGTGLGLATVYGIVKQSNGFIWVDSEVGKGTTFTMYFPASGSATEHNHQSHDEANVATGTERVLVVEDEIILRDALAEYLVSLGYEVLVAGSAEDAVKVAAQYRSIDALVTDLVMPGADGVELANVMSKSHPAMRVIYISGYSDKAVNGLGPSAVLLKKPFALPILASKLREVLDEK